MKNSRILSTLSLGSLVFLIGCGSKVELETSNIGNRFAGKNPVGLLRNESADQTHYCTAFAANQGRVFTNAECIHLGADPETTARAQMDKLKVFMKNPDGDQKEYEIRRIIRAEKSPTANFAILEVKKGDELNRRHGSIAVTRDAPGADEMKKDLKVTVYSYDRTNKDDDDGLATLVIDQAVIPTADQIEEIKVAATLEITEEERDRIRRQKNREHRSGEDEDGKNSTPALESSQDLLDKIDRLIETRSKEHFSNVDLLPVKELSHQNRLRGSVAVYRDGAIGVLARDPQDGDQKAEIQWFPGLDSEDSQPGISPQDGPPQQF